MVKVLDRPSFILSVSLVKVLEKIRLFNIYAEGSYVDESKVDENYCKRNDRRSKSAVFTPFISPDSFFKEFEETLNSFKDSYCDVGVVLGDVYHIERKYIEGLVEEHNAKFKNYV